jgi:hypothetical protein
VTDALVERRGERHQRHQRDERRCH